MKKFKDNELLTANFVKYYLNSTQVPLSQFIDEVVEHLEQCNQGESCIFNIGNEKVEIFKN